MKNHVFALLLCLIAFSGNCQKDTSHHAVTTTPRKTEKAAEGLTERQAYKLLYENQKEANNSILNTIYYALGGLGGATLAVIVGQWWINTRKITSIGKEATSLVETKAAELFTNKKSDLNQLQQKLEQDITTKVNELANQSKDFEVKTQNDIQAGNKRLNEEFEKLIASYNANLSGQIKSLEKVMDERATNSSEKIIGLEKLIDEKIKLQSEQSNLLQKQIDQLQAHLARANALMWRRTGVVENGLMYHIVEANLNFDLKSPIFYLALSNIKECLQEVKEISPHNLNELKNLIKKIPSNDENIKLVKEIETLAQALPVKEIGEAQN